MKKVAFFDIDGTVFRSSLLIALVEKLIDEEIFPHVARTMYEQEYQSWKNREGSYKTYIDAVVASFRSHIKGVYYGDLADVGRIVVSQESKHVYRFTRDLIVSLKEQGYFIVAISQSPKTILDEFCKEYGFDKVYGRIYELGPQDRFTGEMSHASLLDNKALVVERLLDTEAVTLTDSIGVGDTDGDIPLLESVQQPICFNPNQALYTHAQKEGWRVVVERKDVIYEL